MTVKLFSNFHELALVYFRLFFIVWFIKVHMSKICLPQVPVMERPDYSPLVAYLFFRNFSKKVADFWIMIEPRTSFLNVPQFLKCCFLASVAYLS